MKQILFRSNDSDTLAARADGGVFAGIVDAFGNAALKTGQGVATAASAINTRTTNTNSVSYEEHSDQGRGTRIALIAGGSLVAVAAIVLLIVKNRR